MALDIKDNCLNVPRGCHQIGSFVITTSLIVKGADYDVAIDGFAATGAILEHSLGLCQINQRLLNEILGD